MPELSHHRLTDLDNHFGLNFNHHRAICDCETTDAVLKKLNILAESQNFNFSSVVRSKINLSAISPDYEVVPNENPLFKKYCVFTGKLEKYTRINAAKLVVNLGGFCENGVTKKTNFLIVGDFDYSSNIKGGKSSKMQKAEQLILSGQDLQILSETAFYDMLNGS